MAVTARTVQGMAPSLARLAAWPLVSGQSASGGSMSRVAKGHFRRKREAPFDIEGKHVIIQGPSPALTSSVSGLLGEQAHVRKARSRRPRCCPRVTVVALG